MLVEIVGSFVAGLVFDILPTLNMTSVADRDASTASASSFGASLQDSVRVLAISSLFGHDGWMQTGLCAVALATGVGLTTYVMVERKRRTHIEDAS